MPTYTFENKNTGEVFELELKISEREQYLKDNPHLEQLLTSIRVGDSVSLGVTKPPADFQKYVLSKVKQVPGADKNKIEKRWQIAKEI